MMNRSVFIITAALLVAFATRAEDLKIQSFDQQGRLTFHQVPATEYRVEWTTNLFSPVWNSNAPGLAHIPGGGAGSLTVTVGVVHAACFYRVVGVLNPTPPTLKSAFDTDNQGWVIVAHPFRSHVPNPATSSLPFDQTFGNPPGSVRVGDIYGETGIAAPASYLGNKLAFYGGTFSYDTYIRYTDNVAYPELVLNGGSMSVYYEADSPPLDAWQHRVVPLSETGWKVSGTTTPATQAEFKSVLSQLVGLYLYTEWRTGPDDTTVDNIIMAQP